MQFSSNHFLDRVSAASSIKQGLKRATKYKVRRNIILKTNNNNNNNNSVGFEVLRAMSIRITIF
jgi:hypothetical protein